MCANIEISSVYQSSLCQCPEWIISESLNWNYCIRTNPEAHINDPMKFSFARFDRFWLLWGSSNHNRFPFAEISIDNQIGLEFLAFLSVAYFRCCCFLIFVLIGKVIVLFMVASIYILYTFCWRFFLFEMAFSSLLFPKVAGCSSLNLQNSVCRLCTHFCKFKMEEIPRFIELTFIERTSYTFACTRTHTHRETTKTGCEQRLLKMQTESANSDNYILFIHFHI